MLDTLDLLIGLSVVMLFLSMAVTLLTQLFVDFFNQRGRFLSGGVAELLHLIDSGIDAKTARIVSEFILRDELVTGRFLGLFWRRVANTVHREELTKLILGFAVDLRRPLPAVQDPAIVTDDGGNAAAAAPPPAEARIAAAEALARLRAAARQKAIEKADAMGAQAAESFVRSVWWIVSRKKQRLIVLLEAQYLVRHSLARNGITNAEDALSNIRMAALRYEQSNPAMSNSDRQNAAILAQTESEFIAKLNGWFDQTIDRVTDRFSASTRFVTMVAALIVAVALQVDSVALINRLSTDDATRANLVNWAVENSEKLDPAKTEIPKDAEGRKAWLEEQRRALTEAAGTELIRIPRYDFSGVTWRPSTWGAVQASFPSNDAWPGILLSTVFLSLGGPFWYELLKSLLKLRSVVSTKDDSQRQERQTTQTAPAAAGGSSAATGGTAGLLLGGERGDLDAAG